MQIKRTILFKILILLFLSKSINMYSQSTSDTLANKSYRSLIKSFYNTKDKQKAYQYANGFLAKAKRRKDSLRIGIGFYFLSDFKKDSLFVDYCDSIIHYTNNLQTKNIIYPMIGFYNKGDYFYKTRKFDLALKNYLLAINTTTNKTSFYFNLKHRIGILKTRYGNDKEALELFKDANKYYVQNKYDSTLTQEYIPILFALSDSYLRNNQINSAMHYNAIGFRKSTAIKSAIYYNYFRFEQGLIEYKKGNYQSAIDSIYKSIPVIQKNKDLSNLSSANYYTGRAYEKLNDTEKAVIHFKKVDSIYQITKDIHPDLRGGYEYLIKYFDNKKDLNNELIYIKKLLDVDKNLNGKSLTINKELVNQYDTPKLISEKNKIIAKIKIQSHLKNTFLYLFSIILIFLSILIVYQYRKRKKYRQRFEKLMQAKDKNIPKTSNKTPIQIPQKVIDSILNQLSNFEKNQLFLDKNMSQIKLAKYANTNTSYLSIIINTYKFTNYKNYLNNLRLDFIINTLKENEAYRKYTILAISEITGFNNAESFSKAFYKKAGIKPSYFIKNLQTY